MNGESSRILDGQTAWALRHDLEIGDARYAPDLASNLYREPSEASLAELRASDRRPLGERDRESAKPADLQLLDSTLALVCNVFEPAREAPAALATACGGDPLTSEMRLCPTVGQDELTCELDVWFGTDMTAGAAVCRPTAVTACFTEPYRSAKPRRQPANRIPSEWLETSRVWDALPTCRQLALDLRSTPRRYEHIPAADFLCASACLSACYGYRGFRFVHAWYDAGGPAAARYRNELDRFRFRVGGEIDFRALTWQQLLASPALSNEADPRELPDADHLRYVRDRYALD